MLQGRHRGHPDRDAPGERAKRKLLTDSGLLQPVRCPQHDSRQWSFTPRQGTEGLRSRGPAGGLPSPAPRRRPVPASGCTPAGGQGNESPRRPRYAGAEEWFARPRPPASRTGAERPFDYFSRSRRSSHEQARTPERLPVPCVARIRWVNAPCATGVTDPLTVRRFQGVCTHLSRHREGLRPVAGDGENAADPALKPVAGDSHWARFVRYRWRLRALPARTACVPASGKAHHATKCRQGCGMSSERHQLRRLMRKRLQH